MANDGTERTMVASNEPKDKSSKSSKGASKGAKGVSSEPVEKAEKVKREPGVKPDWKRTNYPRLQKQFQEQIAPKLMQEFGLKNPHELPRMTKIVVNAGVGKFLENQKLKPELRETVLSTFSIITGQRAVMILAKKSVANFKVREGPHRAGGVARDQHGERDLHARHAHHDLLRALQPEGQPLRPRRARHALRPSGREPPQVSDPASRSTRQSTLHGQQGTIQQNEADAEVLLAAAGPL
jgi:hypothetical protein